MLSERTAKAILRSAKAGLSAREVARQYGVSPHTVYNIKNGKRVLSDCHKARRCPNCGGPISRTAGRCRGCKTAIKRAPKQCPKCCRPMTQASNQCQACYIAKLRAHGKPKRDNARRLYRAGWTLQQVGDKFGVTKERVRQWLQSDGEPRRKRGGKRSCITQLAIIKARTMYWRQKVFLRKHEARKLHLAGETFQTIADQLGSNPMTVYNDCRAVLVRRRTGRRTRVING